MHAVVAGGRKTLGCDFPIQGLGKRANQCHSCNTTQFTFPLPLPHPCSPYGLQSRHRLGQVRVQLKHGTGSSQLPSSLQLSSETQQARGAKSLQAKHSTRWKEEGPGLTIAARVGPNLGDAFFTFPGEQGKVGGRWAGGAEGNCSRDLLDSRRWREIQELQWTRGS